MAADDAHAHVHDHSHADLEADPTVARVLRGIVAVLVVLTAIGLIVWRGGGGFELPAAFEGQGDRVKATVTAAEDVDCAGVGDAALGQCISISFEVTSGDNAGSVGNFQMYPEIDQVTPTFEVGDDIVVNEFTLGDTGEAAYSFADFQRATPLIVLAVLFVLAVLALGRMQGFRALLGLVVSGFVLLMYVFPALLDGQPPLAVALVASSVIALSALYLAHGFNDTTTVALLGTLGALALTGVLALIFTRVAQITGLASEDQVLLQVSAQTLDLRGLVLAGIVLGSLGVLDDVTVTQVSAVARLREANPDYGVRELYANGVRIGRDHIASTVNTLVLAYAGAALPLLLFNTNIGLGLGDAITSEVIAVEVVRTLVGSIGLVSAVPITTVLAAVVVTGTGFGPLLRRRDRSRPEVSPARARRLRGASRLPAESDDAGWDDFGPTEEDF